MTDVTKTRGLEEVLQCKSPEDGSEPKIWMYVNVVIVLIISIIIIIIIIQKERLHNVVYKITKDGCHYV